jgi:hypothetical protein
MINFRDEIKQFVDDVFELNWDSEEIPFTKVEFINILTDKFQEIHEKALKEQLMETIRNKFNTYKYN